jgi:ABC-2 type transport system permease protein
MTFLNLIRNEVRAVFSNSTILLTVFGGVVFYSFLYPLPYTEQIPRDQQVVVANLDGSQLSRRLERMVDATPQVHIVRRTYSTEEARDLFIREKLAGILVIPEHFHRDLLLGKSPTLSYAGDASYFLVFSTVLEGLAGAGNTLAAEIKVKRLIMSGQALPPAWRQSSALKLNLRSVFNPTSGYVNYVVPAIFVFILHQTLIMGAGILGGTENEARRRGEPVYRQEADPLKLILVRTGLFTIIYWLLCMYYFGFSFEFYAIPRNAHFVELNLVILPFLLGASSFGICLGLLLPRRELATLIVLLSSMPLVFGSGFIWPVESIPEPISAVIQYIPVVPAIRMFLGLNQMGGDFMALLPVWKQMWVCVALYGVLAWMLLHLEKRRYRRTSLRVD